MQTSLYRSLFLAGVTGLLLAATPASSGAEWPGFERILPIDSGLTNTAFVLDANFVTHFHVGGVAAGDVNGNGYIDIVLLRGSNSPRLYLNQGDGTFIDATPGSGLVFPKVGPNEDQNPLVNGVLLADVDGNGTLDVLTGGVRLSSNFDAPKTPMRLFLNDGAGVFSDHTETSNLQSQFDAHSMALADIDGSGRLDLVIAYWHADGDPTTAEGHLWRNHGEGQFEDISLSSGIGPLFSDQMFNFTPNFADINNNGHLDLLMAADFETSRVLVNDGEGNFTNATTGVIDDENGMGATVGDFNNDGQIDWFVTSIWEDQPSDYYGTSGNRLYRSDDKGQFADMTEPAGLREGGWGWGTCAADFNNNGWLDIFMVNGYQLHSPRFKDDPARLFMNNGDGTFSESAAEFGIDSTAQGRSVVCFDSNNNGQIDVLIQNSFPQTNSVGVAQFYRNNGHPDHHWLRVQLRTAPPNVFGVGARITIEAGGTTQMREIRAGNNYLGNDPIEVHFGLGTSETIEQITVRWPDQSTSVYGPFDADQIITLTPATVFSDRFEAP
jgi:enediyne biosynthesis protein E4